MDFVHDELASGHRLRSLTVVDDFTRESVAIEVAHSIPAERVSALLDRAGRRRELPRSIVCDNGPEFTSRALDQWACDRGIELSLIRPGKPVENAFVESFNGTPHPFDRSLVVGPVGSRAAHSGPSQRPSVLSGVRLRLSGCCGRP